MSGEKKLQPKKYKHEKFDTNYIYIRNLTKKKMAIKNNKNKKKSHN